MELCIDFDVEFEHHLVGWVSHLIGYKGSRRLQIHIAFDINVIGNA